MSTKGGSGKSTLATHIAVAALNDYPDATIVDTDPQKSVLLWAKLRGKTPPAAVDTSTNASFVIYDTPPSREPGVLKTATLADLILIPCCPTPFDLMGIRAAIRAAGKTKYAFILNRCQPRVKETNEAKQALKKYHAPILGPINNRIIYVRALTHGLTAPELKPTSPATYEIQHLWQKIKHLL